MILKQGESLLDSPLNGFGDKSPFLVLELFSPFHGLGDSGEIEFSLFRKVVGIAY